MSVSDGIKIIQKEDRESREKISSAINLLINSPWLTGSITNVFENISTATDVINIINKRVNFTQDQKFYPATTSTDLLRKTNNLLAEIKNSNKLGKYEYAFDEFTNTFSVSFPYKIPINFLSERDANNNMATFFKIMWNCLLKNGNVQEQYKQVFISRIELIKKLQKEGIKNVDISWIERTKRNLKNKKIPKFIISQKIIIISDYDKIKEGYWFKIKIS